VANLTVGQLQLIELVKVRMRDARCVILDEPSAVLTPAEAQRLWSLIRELAADRHIADIPSSVPTSPERTPDCPHSS
jgi:ABC-type uncharacterized transport system ATPase subunit